MLDALGLRDGEDWGASLFDDERPPRTCPLTNHLDCAATHQLFRQ